MSLEYIYLNKETVFNNVINLSQLTFEVTDACNLKCKYCGYGDLYGDYDERENKKMPIEVAMKLLEYLYQHWSLPSSSSHKKKTYISFYGGEPLLNMEFIKKIVTRIEQWNLSQCDFIFTMTTNAVLIDKYIDFLLKHNFRILVSLDGNEYNDGYRVDHFGKNSFSIVYKNMKSIQKRYPVFFEQNINFNAVLHDKNNYGDLINFFQEEFAKLPSVSELNPCGIRADRMDEYLKMCNNKGLNLNQSFNSDALKQILFMDTPETALLCSYLHWHSGNVFKKYTDLLLDENVKRWYPTGTCLPFGKKMFVTVNGKILPCERVSHEYALGYVNEEEVVIDIGEIVEKYNLLFAKYIPQCSKCYNNHTCKHCMFYNADLKGDARCDRFMNEKDFNNYVEAQYRYLSENPSLYKKIMTEVIIH